MNDLSKDAVNRITVGEDAQGQRLDNYLVKILKGVPKSHIYRIVRSGEVRVNRQRAGPDARLASGDELRVPPIRAQPRRASGVPAPGQADARSIGVPPTLFEDEALLIVDKPSGMAVHGGSGISHGVIERFRHARPDAKFIELVHRLDRDTSGVLLLAKKRGALTDLHAQLREGTVDKRYLVLVRGKWRDALRSVDLALESHATGGEKRVRVTAEGRRAVTVFRRQRTWAAMHPPMALLEAELKTGRTHQIRVHLAHLGFPLAGDDKYGDFPWNRALAKEGLKRMFLHARSMTFRHPVSGEQMTVNAALPADLQSYLRQLDSRSSTADEGVP
ncbi:MAG: RluA family pseudouridine synthase [Betaproteobacteria bacterium]